EVHEDIYKLVPDLWEETQRVVRESGWGDMIDQPLLTKGLMEKSGGPTDVTKGGKATRFGETVAAEVEARMEHKVDTSKRCEVIDLAPQIAEAVKVAHINEGLCNIYVPHATAAIIINENDDQQIGLDLLDALDKLIPQGVWRHDQVDSNGAAHLKAAILG